MGKKGLLISVICSIIVVVVLGVSSLVHVITPKDKKPENGGVQVVDQTINEGNNKGSKEDPYYIYDADTFTRLLSLYGSKEKNCRKLVEVPVMVDVVENGQTVKVEKKDENGNTIYEAKKDELNHDVYEDVKDENGVVAKEPYHFELYNDIDFSDVEYKTLFNDGTSFIGKIDGKGFSVKNISINVTVENLKDYLFSQGETTTSSYAHIGIFGDVKNAVIENIVFSDISVNVSDDIYRYVSESLWDDHKTSLSELTVGVVAACAENSTIKANVIATVDANSYGVYYEAKNTGKNFVGGVVGYAVGSTISNLDAGSINVKITTDGASKAVYVGGVVGGLYQSKVEAVDLSAEINSVSQSQYYIGGVAGYVMQSQILNSRVKLDVKQVEEVHAFNTTAFVSNKTILSKFNGVGGVASVVRANNDEQETVISNVKVVSTVDMDCIFGGVLFRVNSSDETQENTYVQLINNTVSSDVKALKAYGVGFMIPHTKIEYTPDYMYGIAKSLTGLDEEYNILIKGEILIETGYVTVVNGDKSYEQRELSATIISQDCSSNDSVEVDLKQIKFLASLSIYDAGDMTLRIDNLWGASKYV